MKIREAFANWLRGLDVEGLGYRLGRRFEDLADRLDPPRPGQWTQMGWIDETHLWVRPGSIFVAPMDPPPMPSWDEILKTMRDLPIRPAMPTIKLRQEAIDRLLDLGEIKPEPFQRRMLDDTWFTGIPVVEDKPDAQD